MKKTIAFYLDEIVIQTARKSAKARGITVSQYVNALLLEALELKNGSDDKLKAFKREIIDTVKKELRSGE